MKRHVVIISFFLCMMFGVGAISAENSDKEPVDAPYLSDQMVATAPQGDLPARITGNGFILVKTGSVSIGLNEIAAYSIKENRAKVETSYAIEFLKHSVSSACVDYDLIHGTPGGYIEGGTVNNIQTAPTSSAQQFNKQWGFQHINLDPHTATGGENTLIAVLDAFQPDSDLIWDDPNVTFVTPTTLPTYQPPNAPNVELHGSMVTSLARAVAPESSVMQVATLNEWGIGHLFGVVEALDYVLSAFESLPQEYLVINMSFGASHEDKCGLIERLLAEGDRRYNVVYVAAAGNGGTSDTSTPPLYPARSQHVVAVAASNNAYQMTSYSHLGDVMAPGGEQVDPNVSACQQQATIVLGYAPTTIGAQSNTLLCSIGTSFSAPLVAGLAAAHFGVSATTDTAVIDLIESGAVQNSGVIDVSYPSIIEY